MQESWNAQHSRRGRKYLLAMVGLPARGKTYTARKLVGYFSWLGYPTRSFNVGERRRRFLGAGQPHSFFDASNAQAFALREQLTDQTLDDAFAFLAEGGRLAVFDATNSTRERRAKLRMRTQAAGVELVFIELVERDEAVVEESVRAAKLPSPDYSGMGAAEAMADFRKRIAHYEQVYQTVGQDEGIFIRVEGRGRTVTSHQARGWILGRIVSFLNNVQVTERPIWLTRHGESIFNQAGRIGGDSVLSERGQGYAQRLAEHVRNNMPDLEHLDVWTSTLKRSIMTAAALGIESGPWRALDEIDAGICDGLSYRQIEARWPDEYAERKRDKLRYRYPGGESYEDVIQRVDRVIVELEGYTTPVLVVGHRAVLRALYAYFKQLPREQTPHLDMPLHTIIKLTTTAYGCLEERVELAVD